MNIIKKFTIHLSEMVKKRSLKFVIHRSIQIINRRIPLKNEVYLSGMVFSDELVLEKFLNPSKNLVVVDIGANYGLWTLRFSIKHKEIHAFEPNPNSFAFLKRNTRKRENVKLYCCALGKEKGIGNFFIHERPVMDGFVRKLEDFKKTIKVPIRNLDDFNIDADLIKIDTQGYELPILMGGLKTIENNKPQLYIELHVNEQKKPILDLLKKYGYTYSIFKLKTRIYPMIITDYITAGM